MRTLGGHPRSGPGAHASFRYLQEIAGCGCLHSPPPPPHTPLGAWIALLFFCRLLLAADSGEQRRAGRTAWGMGAEGSWTAVNPEKKKKSLAGPQVGWRGWRGRRAGVSVQRAWEQRVASRAGCVSSPSTPGEPGTQTPLGLAAGGGGSACGGGGGEGECVARASGRRRIRKSPRRSAQTCLIAVT